MSYLKAIYNFIKAHYLIAGAVVVLVGGGAYWQFGRNTAPEYETTAVERGTVSQEVSVTGRVKAAEAVDLSFEPSGRVSAILATVGQTVAKDAVLVELSATSSLSDVRQAQAALLAQRATLDELKRGTRTEELTIARTKVANAETTLADAKTALTNATTQATADLDALYADVENLLNTSALEAADAVYNQLDDFFIDEATTPRLSYITSDTQAQLDAENGRRDIVETLDQLKSLSLNLSVSSTVRDAALLSAIQYLQDVKSFLDVVSDTLSVSTSLNSTTLATYKGYLSTARGSINTELSALTGRRDAITTQRAANQISISTSTAKVNDATRALDLAKDELALKEAGTTAEKIRAEEAELARLEANLTNTQALYEKTKLRSPFAGIVTRLEVKLGEVVSPSTPVASVISENLFQIEADVPEADIAKVKVANKSEVTLDAYGSEVLFSATIVKIDPAERIIDGVATYRVTLQFDTKDERIRSGMTANVDIYGAHVENVLRIPLRAVINQADKKIVRVLIGQEVREVQVETGLRGTDGNIEIISGLNEGDLVILFSSDAG